MPFTNPIFTDPIFSVEAQHAALHLGKTHCFGGFS